MTAPMWMHPMWAPLLALLIVTAWTAISVRVARRRDRADALAHHWHPSKGGTAS